MKQRLRTLIIVIFVNQGQIIFAQRYSTWIQSHRDPCFSNWSAGSFSWKVLMMVDICVPDHAALGLIKRFKTLMEKKICEKNVPLYSALFSN